MSQKKSGTTRWSLLVTALCCLALLGAKGGCGGPSVCDFNGKSYQIGDTFPAADGCNQCNCASDGAVECTNSACFNECGGDSGKSCAADSYCAYSEGSCGNNKQERGMCEKKPENCTTQYSPVCGCDNNTYGNACGASAAGVSVQYQGKCTTSGQICNYNGKAYKEGDTFPATDGCNTCTCTNGQAACTKKACPSDGCTYDGKAYKEGESFPSTDGCNTCTCKSGQVPCTEKACPPTGCTYDGMSYKEGESFPATDGCNTCTCTNGSVGCTKIGCPPVGCTYDGKTYKEGESFPATDGCNTCSCQNGQVGCTKKGCPPGGCTYDGKSYKEGESFPATDGCNTCTCGGGQVACTEKACASSCTYNGQTYKEGESFPAMDGCNTCTCSNGQAGCTKKACQGCGSRGLKPCASGDYCNQPGHCGATDIPGSCQTIPKGCTREYWPVCGCDDKTYSNPCMASAAGVSIKTNGACVPKLKSCTYNGTTYPHGASFKATDGCNTCGCTDGLVACTKIACPQSCGSRGLKPCPSGQYCDQPGHCGATDIPGTCQEIKIGCPRNLDPVCGCDGKNYGNPCNAAAAGTSVAKKGPC